MSATELADRVVGPAAAPDAQVTDEDYYLSHNPDVAAAVQSGAMRCGHDHWMAFGRFERRLPRAGYTEGEAVRAEWYEQAYPAARADIAAGRARDAADHYVRLGRARGYRPNSFAERPDNPAGHLSRFGGTWLDQGNALDLIEGKRQIGRLDAADAALLGNWVRDGYVILRGAVSRRMADRAAADLHAAYDGRMPQVKFECPHIGGYAPVGWDPAVKEQAAKALDLHWWSQPICDVIFADPVRRALELIFERRALASQSLTFLLGSSQGYHQDSLYVPFILPTQFVASWIALEDVTPGGGELKYYPGSHKLPDFLYGDKFKTLWDAQLVLGKKAIHGELATYSDDLEARCVARGLQPETFLARKGDVLLWHADLAHGGMPISRSVTRASVVTHYCPSEVASLTFEQGSTAMRPHGKVASYSTRYYAG